MIITDNKKMVIFGAGKIGRSFIGQLFSRGGYEVVFIDSNIPVIDELNLRHKYKVIIKSDHDEIIWVDHVRGVRANYEDEVAGEIATAGIIAVSVGQAGLPSIMPLLAKGLLKRFQLDPACPLDIIIAENLRNGSDYFRVNLQNLLPGDYPLNRLAGLVETSIGKMVPIMQKKDIAEDILQIFAEPYNTLILDKQAFKNPVPAIEGLAPKENMKAWVDRKLFIHNLGHATSAYLAFVQNPEYIYLYEALANVRIYTAVRETMLQAANILKVKYPGEFTDESLTGHVDDLLLRFQNRSLGDTIFRVGCDLIRKFAPEDRIAGAIRLAVELGLPYGRILYALVCGSRFRAKDEQGHMLKDDLKFSKIYAEGIDAILTRVCGFNPADHSNLYYQAKVIDNNLSVRLEQRSS